MRSDQGAGRSAVGADQTEEDTRRIDVLNGDATAGMKAAIVVWCIGLVLDQQCLDPALLALGFAWWLP